MKDIHLLKSLQKQLKENESIGAAEILDVLTQVKTQSMINQGFKILAYKFKNVQVFQEVIEKYLKLYCDDGEFSMKIRGNVLHLNV